MSQKILILEDETFLGRFYQKYLEKYQFQTKLTKTPDETLKLAELYPADYVLLDHGIKDSNLTGLDILPQLRRQLPLAKIIMFTSYDEYNLEVNSLKSGADIFLNKLNYGVKDLLHVLV